MQKLFVLHVYASYPADFTVFTGNFHRIHKKKETTKINVSVEKCFIYLRN